MTEGLDLEQFREAFLAEAKENLQLLNRSLLSLEKNPDEPDTIKSIFRVAHTLKGMAATMGFENITRLSHQMEEILDKIRKGKSKITPKLLDLLFNCMDVLEKLIHGGLSAADEASIVEPLVGKLKKSWEEPQEPTPSTTGPAVKTEVGTESVRAGLKPAPTNMGPDARPAADNSGAGAGPAPTPVAQSQETQQIQARPAAVSQESSIRVNVSRLDSLMNLVGEMVINKGRLEEIGTRLKIPELQEALSFFDRVGTELQEAVLKTRMVPVSHIFDRFPRMVRDVARKLDKEVDLEISGNDIEIDRNLLEQINDPLVHILRNAIDHGIETKEERARSGKKGGGTIRLSARREQSAVLVEVSDDGRGMSAQKLKALAIEKGILTPETAEKISDRDAFYLICDPRFSSAKQVTDISGRGVGMDVVKTAVESFNGTLQIDSVLNQGSSMALRLPLSLAIVRVLLIRLRSEIYAVPLSNISEIVAITLDEIKTVDKQQVILLRDKILPLVWLEKLLGVPADSGPDNGDSDPTMVQVLVIEVGGKKVGFCVDRFLGRREIVVKTLSGVAKYARGFSGATILGDGRVILILDVGAWT